MFPWLVVLALLLAWARPGHASPCTAEAPLPAAGDWSSILIVDCTSSDGVRIVSQVIMSPAQVRNMYQLWQAMMLRQPVRPFDWPLWFSTLSVQPIAPADGSQPTTPP